MGLTLSTAIRKLLDPITRLTEAKIVMVGLDAAGKTTITYNLRIGEVVQTIPTIGFNVESVHYNNIKFTVWDIGGQDKIRPLWRHYYSNASAVIYVVDSADRERIDEAADELHSLMRAPELAGVPVLVFANKQDATDALRAEQVSKHLEMNHSGDRKWHVQPCCGRNGDGLYEGLDWLASEIRR